MMSIKVPIFNRNHIEIVNDIAEIILDNIETIVKTFFNNIETNSTCITPVKHNVDIKEISNELWHQVFGATNEYLVKCGFVKEPYSNP